jgi:hypothetical protein
MSKCVAAGAPAGVIVCAFFALSGAVSAQEVSPIPISPEEIQEQPPSSSDPTTSDDAEQAADSQADPDDDDVTLPGVTVTTSGGGDSRTTTAQGGVSGGAGGGGSSAGGGGGDGASDKESPDGVILGGGAVADTGMTVFDSKNVLMRTDGSGDANTFLRNLPNVQYQDLTDENPGASAAKAVDTRPLLLSISGARTYENNFILNGVSITNITGAVDGNAPENLGDDEVTPNAYGVYGLHPQTIYVPSEFIDEATIIDSNASAEYGQFEGGVVIYDLAAPPTDRYHAYVDVSRHTSDMVNYILATEDGINVNNRVPPSFSNTNLAASVGAPITPDFAFIAQASRKEAEATKQQVFYIGDGFVEEYSDNIFLRFAATARTDIGKFTFDVSHTDYSQHWQNAYGRDLYIDTLSETTSTQLKFERDLGAIRAASVGLGGVKLESRAFYNVNETRNLSDGNTVYYWYNQRLQNYDPVTGWEERFDTSLHDDWCQGVDPATYPGATGSYLFGCREGGYGNKLQGQTDFGVQAKIDGDLLLGHFKLGTELKQYEGRRARFEDYYFQAANRVAEDTSGIVEFTCGNDVIMCDSEQYAISYSIFRKHDVSAIVNAAHTFAEVDQTWEWLNVRAGMRVDYDDYFENLNLAPRLATTVTIFEGLSVTGGYNRYYLGETLYYAVRDQMPRGETHLQGHDSSGVVYDRNITIGGDQYINRKASDLNTPYSDELTGAVQIKDPLFGGQLRLKYLERQSEEQFQEDECVIAGVTQCYTLTNDGWREYRSASAEYTKAWNRLDTPFYLSGAAITGQITWSEQTASRLTYLDDEEDENPIYYNGQSYTRTAWTEVTGNLDIPVRIGATLSTAWFDNVLQLNLSAGINLGYEGVHDTDTTISYNGITHDYFVDKKFATTLQLDASGYVNVTEQAMIEFHVNNITNSTGNVVATYANPYVLGRSFWLGSSLRF